MNYAEIEKALNNAAGTIAEASRMLAHLSEQAQVIVGMLNTLVTQSGSVATELDARLHPETGDMLGNPAWELQHARKNELVANLLETRAIAQRILAAIQEAQS